MGREGERKEEYQKSKKIEKGSVRKMRWKGNIRTEGGGGVRQISGEDGKGEL
jgi:hypothetical protein